jgi:hypothetical protein
MSHSEDIDVSNIDGMRSGIFIVLCNAVLFSKFPFSKH